MDNFKAVYRILSQLERDMDRPKCNLQNINHEQLGVSEERWAKYIEMMSDVGYIKDARIKRNIYGELLIECEDMVERCTIFGGAFNLSGKDVLMAICEINGCFGHIGRNGKMQYVILEEIESGLFPANDLYPIDGVFPYDGNTEKLKRHHYISCKYEDYTAKRIGKLQIRQEENDIGCIIGNGENS